MASLITGLDIGSSQIKGVVCAPRKDGTFSVITAFKRPSNGFKRGVLADIDEATATLREVATDLQRISRHATENVMVNINSPQVWARSSQGMVAVARADQEIQQEDIDRASQTARTGRVLQNRTVLHNIVREYLVDGVGDIADPLGMTGNRLEVSTLIVEAFAPHYTILERTLERVGIGAIGFIFNPLAAEKAILTRQRKELGALLIDFGFGTTTFVVYEEGKAVHTKSIPVGASYITHDIVAGFTIPMEVAERLKTSYGYAISKDVPRKDLVRLSEVDPNNITTISKREMSEIIEARLEEILQLVNNELNALGHKLHFPGGVIITGGGVKMPGMTEIVQQSLHFPTQVGFPDLNQFDIPNPAHQELLDDPEFAVALGLVLWSGENKKSSSSFGDKIKQVFRNLV